MYCKQGQPAYHSYGDMSDEELQEFIAKVGEDKAQPFLSILEKQKREIKNNPNPWNWYFEKGQIVDDLDNLIKSIKCYKDKDVTEIYLTAG